MVRVLVIGYAPDAVDFTDPAIPPGLTEALVAEGGHRPGLGGGRRWRRHGVGRAPGVGHGKCSS